MVTCNKRKTAAKIIDEYNGFEFELTNLRLQLSCVDDALVVPSEAKEVATEVPPGYEFNASRVSRALNHSSVKLSWD